MPRIRAFAYHKMIEDYLQAITSNRTEEFQPLPLVESLTGVVPSQKDDSKRDYKDYLSDKYQ